MMRSCLLTSILVLSGALSCLAQDQASNSSPSQSAPPASAPAQPQDSAASKDAKKTKKVWSNEDVTGLNSSVSVVGNSKNLGQGSSGLKADPQYIAEVRKQLEKLQTQLADTDKEITDLKNFSRGEQPVSSGYPINKGYGRIPVDQQISNLQAKKKDLQTKIDALLDEARKKGIQPGDLR
jgi:hypothetical protein